MKPRVIVGLAILLAVLLGGGLLVMWFQGVGGRPVGPSTAAPAVVKCAGGSEKSALMRDPEVVAILAADYGISLDFRSMGSYAQVLLSADEIRAQGFNCLWPSSGSARLVFESGHRGEFAEYRAQTVLQSPEVVYSGPQATDALTRAGLVTDDGGSRILDIKGLLAGHVLTGDTWEKLQAGRLAGPVRIATTDAATSNSGFTMAQLQLTVIATEDVSVPPTLEQARAVLPTMRHLYETAGLQASSSDGGFRQWLTQGGEYAAPLYAGYENQIIQLATTSPDPARVLANVSILYPSPTIYSDHPILALDAAGSRLVDAMSDPRIQALAWQKYGFRSAFDPSLNDTSRFGDLPLAAQVRTIPAPSGEVTLALLHCFEDATQCS